jgi:hypothetical protein
LGVEAGGVRKTPGVTQIKLDNDATKNALHIYLLERLFSDETEDE